MSFRERQKFLIWWICCILIATTKLLNVNSASSSEEDSLSVESFFESEESEEDELDKQLAPIDHNWDVLIFTQQWPVTFCYHWKEEDKSHNCNLPSKQEFWTIHGIWPTKYGHIGPNFCNKSADFDVNTLTNIVDKLNLAWPNIETGQEYDSLWRHEWLKHGTCAATLEQLDNELKYFEQGLNWRNRFLISNILGDSKIHPDSNNTIIAIHTALIRSLGKNPAIHCLYDNDKDVSYLSEIRICFDKTLQLTDCDGVPGERVFINYPGGSVNTNCHVSKLIHYPSTVPPVEKDSTWEFPFVNVYKLLQFIMWFTM